MQGKLQLGIKLDIDSLNLIKFLIGFYLRLIIYIIVHLNLLKNIDFNKYSTFDKYFINEDANFVSKNCEWIRGREPPSILKHWFCCGSLSKL